MTLSEFLNLDVSDYANIDSIFDYYNNHLNSLPNEKFSISSITATTSIAKKYIDSCLTLNERLKRDCKEHLEMVESLTYHCKNLNKNKASIFLADTIYSMLFGKRYDRILSHCEQQHSEIQSNALVIYSEAIKGKPRPYHFELSGFFQPNNSNKDLIKKLISEAIDLINLDTTLSTSAKNSIIGHFREILDEINKNKTNWSAFFGKAKEVIIVLQAITTLTGDVSENLNLREAEEKIHQATIVVERTSINYNQYNLTQILQIDTFNSPLLLDTSTTKPTLQLPTTKLDNDENSENDK